MTAATPVVVSIDWPEEKGSVIDALAHLAQGPEIGRDLPDVFMRWPGVVFVADCLNTSSLNIGHVKLNSGNRFEIYKPKLAVRTSPQKNVGRASPSIRQPVRYINLGFDFIVPAFERFLQPGVKPAPKQTACVLKRCRGVLFGITQIETSAPKTPLKVRRGMKLALPPGVVFGLK